MKQHRTFFSSVNLVVLFGSFSLIDHVSLKEGRWCLHLYIYVSPWTLCNFCVELEKVGSSSNHIEHGEREELGILKGACPKVKYCSIWTLGMLYRNLWDMFLLRYMFSKHVSMSRSGGISRSCMRVLFFSLMAWECLGTLTSGTSGAPQGCGCLT